MHSVRTSRESASCSGLAGASDAADPTTVPIAHVPWVSPADVEQLADVLPSGADVGVRLVPPDEPSLVLSSMQRRSTQLHQLGRPDRRPLAVEEPDTAGAPLALVPAGYRLSDDAGVGLLRRDEQSGMERRRESEWR